MANNIIEMDKYREIELKKYINKIRFGAFVELKRTNDKGVFAYNIFSPYVMGFIYDNNFFVLDEPNKKFYVYPINIGILGNVYSYTKPGLYVNELQKTSFNTLDDLDFYIDYVIDNIHILHTVDKVYAKLKKTGSIPYSNDSKFLEDMEEKISKKNVIVFKKAKIKLIFNKFVNKITSIMNNKEKK